MSHKDFDEADFLTCCALRIDGWKYQERTGFDHRKLIDDYFLTSELRGSDLELFTTFFGLQRALFKWGLEREAQHGRYWRLFRTLFLRVCDVDVPDEYRLEGNDYYRRRWTRKYAPQLAEHVACVRRIHETTNYQDDVIDEEEDDL